MIDFYVTDLDGQITMSGRVPTQTDAELNKGNGRLYYGTVPDGMTHFNGAKFEDRRPAPSYAELRRAEYPPLSDLADAMYWINQGDESKMQAYLAACDAVKAKYPKVE